MTRRKLLMLASGGLVALLLALGVVAVLGAPDSALDSAVFGAGGGASASTNYGAGFTAGQAIAGTTGAPGFSGAELGYWYAATPDTDGDGCADVEEAGINELLGGRRNRLDRWDFFDVPRLSPPAPRDKQIDLNDVFDVLAKFGAVVGDPMVPPAPPYDPAYDRGAPPNPASPNPWNTHAPDGTNQLDDVFEALVSFGHSCFPPP